MIFYSLILVTTVCIAGLVKSRERCACGPEGVCRADRRQYFNRACIGLLFTVLFLVSACRYELGNDYKRYLEFFRLISKNQYVPTEVGFNALVRFMQALFGSEAYLSIFAFCAAFTIALMLKALYDLSEDFALSFFLFMCFGYFFYSMNSVRYYMAVSVVMVSARFAMKHSYGKFLLLVLFAALFHKSALIAIPVYILASRSYRKWQYALLVTVMASGIFLRDFYLAVLLRFYPTYENTELLDGGTSLVNIARCLAVLLFSLLYYREAVKEQPQAKFYFHLNLMALLLYTCCSFLPEISRIGYYMTVGHIFLIPMILARITDKRRQRIWRILIVTASLLYFAAFLYKAFDPLIKLLPYRTWFFTEPPRFEEFGV